MFISTIIFLFFLITAIVLIFVDTAPIIYNRFIQIAMTLLPFWATFTVISFLNSSYKRYLDNKKKQNKLTKNKIDLTSETTQKAAENLNSIKEDIKKNINYVNNIISKNQQLKKSVNKE